MSILKSMNPTLEDIYDRYSRVMYGVAFQITSNEEEAEKILMAGFKKMHILKNLVQRNPATSLQFIKLTVETAFELFPGYKTKHWEIKQFHTSPVLYQLIFENKNIQALCTKYGLTVPQLTKKIRSELSILANIKKRYLVKAITISA
jgi:hypothetical protein